MTHDEIVKEFRRISKYLQSRAKDINVRNGENRDFANEMDKWHYELLMQVCATVQEPQSVTPYIKIDVPDMRYAHGTYGIEI